MAPVNRLNMMIPGGDIHVVPSATSTCLDVHNILDSYPPILRFTDEEERRGRQLLESLGVERGRYVCVIVRDAAYYKKALPNQDLSYHDYRNCDVDTYVAGMEALAERGLHVLRMGALVEKQLHSDNPHVIDYANSTLRTDFADIYLGANCKFCVSDGLGYYTVPAAFRRPNAYVNYSPFHMFYSSRASDLGISKVFTDSQSGEIVPLKHLIGKDVARLTRTELIAASGLRVKDNTPQEICELMLEMNDRIDGVWKSEAGDDQLQTQFWEMFKRVIGDEGLKIHGEFRSRFGAQYLRDHRDWFAE
jgi:putative glycosyltransferase (TIGR04372 family)